MYIYQQGQISNTELKKIKEHNATYSQTNICVGLKSNTKYWPRTYMMDVYDTKLHKVNWKTIYQWLAIGEGEWDKGGSNFYVYFLIKKKSRGIINNFQFCDANT